MCDCNPGYTLDSDGVSCTGKIRHLRLLLILHTYIFAHMCLFIVALLPGGGGSLYSGLYGNAPPGRFCCCFFVLPS